MLFHFSAVLSFSMMPLDLFQLKLVFQHFWLGKKKKKHCPTKEYVSQSAFFGLISAFIQDRKKSKDATRSESLWF